MKRLILTLGLAFAVTPAWSADEDREGLFGSAGLGALMTSGNTDTTTINGVLDGNYGSGRWLHTLTALAIFAETGGLTTAERYELGLKSDYELSDVSYLFGLIQAQSDRFGAYDSQIREAVGYGRRLINNDTHVLNAEIGVGARQAELNTGTGTTVSQDEFIVRAGGDYKWVINPNADFTQVLAVESGSDNTYIESVSAVRMALAGRLGLRVSYTLKHNTDVIGGLDDTDTFTAINLDYTFGGE